MRISGFLAILALFAVALSPQAYAGKRGFFDWIFTPDAPDFENRLMYDGKTPHVYTWSDDNWTPEGWTEFRGTNKGVMDDFYAAGIITDQYEEDDMLVLEVGQTFMSLSNQEKYRVAAYVDDVFGVTHASENGSFRLVHEKSNDTLGFYTSRGLQLQ